MRCATALLLVVWTDAFLYQPGSKGQIWDPSVTWWRGRWYAHAMYQFPGDPTNTYKAGWLATSSDGVHWEDGGPVAPENSTAGDMWWKGFVRQIRGDASNLTDEALFIMDHGVDEPGIGNDALRFLTSTDLKNWTYNSTSHPDPRWYRRSGRWDHMYMSRDSDSGGFIGFAVSSPIVPGYAGTWPAVQRSSDGIHWEIGAPLNVTWSGVSPTGIEEGGFEWIQAADGTGKYFLIGGGGGPLGKMAYSMFVFSADHIDGPYAPVADAFRLSGGSTGKSGRYGWLAAWCGPHCDGTANGTPLVSNYITPGENARADVWMLPLRKPIADEGGLLRLGYWSGNDVLRGRPIPVTSTSGTLRCTGEPSQGPQIMWLATANATVHAHGGILVASLAISDSSSGATVGVVLEDIENGTSSGIYLEHTDLEGGDYRYFGVNYTDPHRCEAACDSDAECVAWTYVGAGAALADAAADASDYPIPRCCLKNVVPLAKDSTSCTSGIRRKSTGLLFSTLGQGSASAAAELVSIRGESVEVIDRAAAFPCGTGDSANKTCGVATVTNLNPGQTHSLQVMFRRGMFEVYVDDLLAQNFVYGGVYPLPSTGIGRIGLACAGGASSSTFSATKAWQMTLPS